MFGTRCQQFSWCWKHSFVFTYFQDHYVEASMTDNLISMCFWIYCKKLPQGIYHDSDWNLYQQSGKCQGIFFCQPCGNSEQYYIANVFGRVPRDLHRPQRSHTGLRPIGCAGGFSPRIRLSHSVIYWTGWCCWWFNGVDWVAPHEEDGWQSGSGDDSEELVEVQILRSRAGRD